MLRNFVAFRRFDALTANLYLSHYTTNPSFFVVKIRKDCTTQMEVIETGLEIE